MHFWTRILFIGGITRIQKRLFFRIASFYPGRGSTRVHGYRKIHLWRATKALTGTICN